VSGRICSACGIEIQEDFRFCPACGTSSRHEQSAFTGTRLIREQGDALSIHHWLDYNQDNVFEDYTVKRNDEFSYCIRDHRANDLRIVKKFAVLPDTIYYVTADVRTENVINHENKEDPVGACISTHDWFFSKNLFGTNHWKTVGVLGRSDEWGNITVSFNLGYTFNTCSGCAWFENIRFIPVDEITKESSTWKFLAVLLTESGIDTFDSHTGTPLQLHHVMSNEERTLIRNSLHTFEKDMNLDAEGLFSIEVDILEAQKPYTDYAKNNFGYVVSRSSARRYLESLGVDILSYDHVILIACQPGLPVNYYGLGGLSILDQVGYSFILHADLQSSMPYLRGERENSWIPSIYVHEFLHSIERCANSLNLPVPLIDGDRFGYPDVEEYRSWYRDFMHKRLRANGNLLGVDPRIWKLKPSFFS
jgi:hypothetical protein